MFVFSCFFRHQISSCSKYFRLMDRTEEQPDIFATTPVHLLRNSREWTEFCIFRHLVCLYHTANVVFFITSKIILFLQRLFLFFFNFRFFHSNLNFCRHAKWRSDCFHHTIFIKPSNLGVSQEFGFLDIKHLSNSIIV